MFSDGRGRQGWGEIAPLAAFSPASLTRALRDAQQVMAQVHTTDDLRAVLLRGSLLCSVRSGLEQARWQMDAPDTWRAGCPVRLQVLLNGSPEQILSDARLYASSNIRAAKVKVGQRSVSEDIRMVREVHSILPQAQLRLDANQAWHLDQARRFVARVIDCNVDYLEEPSRDREDLLQLLEESPLPIALDETLRDSVEDDLVRAAEVFVIKPTLMGGLQTAEKFVRNAAKAGKRCIISSAWESGIGMHALMQLGAGLPSEAHGLDTYRYYSHDVLRLRLQLNSPTFILPARLPSADDIDWQCIESV